jgi:subtilisin family serine protease
MAQGSNAAVISTGGNVDFSSGTSFSSPIMAGVVTCLWQSRLEVPNGHIMQIIRESASLYNNPTDEMGYGIPNFEDAYVALQQLGVEDEFLMSNFALYPNPVTSKINISFPEGISNATFTIYSILGNKILSTEISRNLNSVNMEALNSGMYIASIISNNKQISFKIIKE